MKYYFIFILLFIFVSSCGKDQKDNSFKKESQIKKHKKDTITTVLKKKEEKEKLKDKKDPWEAIKDNDFFKAGFKEIDGRKLGIYLVVSGDNVWVIAKKYLEVYKKKENITETDIGNVAYKINLVNYDNLFCGVNDELKWGAKVLIPIE